MEQGGPKPKSFLTWRQPCQDVAELANAKGWSQEEREVRMKYHIYKLTDYEWTDTSIRFKANHEGIE